MTAHDRTRRMHEALGLHRAEPTPGDVIMIRLVEVEAKLRLLGCDKAANLAARFQADIAKSRAAFLYERWTADIEAFAERKTVERARAHYEAQAAKAQVWL